MTGASTVIAEVRSVCVLCVFCVLVLMLYDRLLAFVVGLRCLYDVVAQRNDRLTACRTVSWLKDITLAATCMK
jgi:hypothetical protein